MIIDCHTHLKYDETGADQQEHLENSQQVDHAFVLADCTQTSTQANKAVADYVSRHEKMIGFAVINPLTDKVDVEDIAKTVDSGSFKGLVLYCSYAGFHPCHSRAMRVYQAAIELGLPVFFHNSGSISQNSDMQFAQPWLIDEVAITFPQLKIILASMARPFVAQTLELLNKHPNVFGDLTISPEKLWQTYNTVVQAYEAGVMEKLIFGSGYPHSTSQKCVETLLGFNKLLANSNLPNVPRERIRSIIERNAMELLGINA